MGYEIVISLILCWRPSSLLLGHGVSGTEVSIYFDMDGEQHHGA